MDGILESVAFLLFATAAAAYFLGCFNGAVIISKYILRDDVRSHGSGNAGLTNFYRTFGGPLTLAVILCDVLKAVIAVWLGTWLLGQATGWLLPAGAYVPVYVPFQGRQGHPFRRHHRHHD